MLGYSFTYDGTVLPTYKAQATSDWIVEDIDWAKPTVSNSQINNQFWHGTIANPTFARGRLITLTGKIFATTKAARGTARNIVDTLFQLDTFPSQGGGFKTLAFTDDDGITKFIDAKVYTKPDYLNGQGDAIIEFSVDLFAQDPLIKSTSEVTANGNYGFFGGVALPTTLPIALNGVDGDISASNAGNFASPVTVTIDDEIVNPKILNITTGRFFELELSMSAGDQLIIDSDNRTVKLNGGSVLSQRVNGSNWIFANVGSNDFVLLGDDYDATDTTKVSFEVSFYSAWL